MADMLVEAFSANSSISSSSLYFLAFKDNAGERELRFSSNNFEKYDQPFTPAELQGAVGSSSR